MNPAKASESRVIQLDARNEGGMVTVVPHNEDRYNLRVPEVIRACQQFVSDGLSREHFDFLVNRIQTWVLQRRDLRDAYLTVRDGGLLFLMVRRTAAYDGAFEDELSDLDVDLAEDRDVRFPVDVMALPPASTKSIDSFLHPHLTLRFSLSEMQTL